jgi:hypothetical protein
VRDANVASQTVSPSPGISQEQLLKDHKPIQATVSALQEWLAADQKKLVTACDRITDWFNKETGLQTDSWNHRLVPKWQMLASI